MSISSLLHRLSHLAIRRTPPKVEAAQNLLGKASKLDIALDAVVVEDIRAVAANERESVSHYMRRQDLLPKAHKKSKADDMIVCDDYHVSNGSGLAGILAAMVAAAGITAGGMKYFMPPTPTLPPVEPKEVEIEVWSDGSRFEFRPKE